MDNKSLDDSLEKFAGLAHEMWSGWMKYMFSKSTYHKIAPDKHFVTIPAELVERWERQMNTPYSDLPESEKESDRVEARKIIEIAKQGIGENDSQNSP